MPSLQHWVKRKTQYFHKEVQFQFAPRHWNQLSYSSMLIFVVYSHICVVVFSLPVNTFFFNPIYTPLLKLNAHMGIICPVNILENWKKPKQKTTPPKKKHIWSDQDTCITGIINSLAGTHKTPVSCTIQNHINLTRCNIFLRLT
jgi:hypothetical protein